MYRAVPLIIIGHTCVRGTLPVRLPAHIETFGTKAHDTVASCRRNRAKRRAAERRHERSVAGLAGEARMGRVRGQRRLLLLLLLLAL